MTVSYSDATWRLLFRWRGSIWQACYIELIIYLLCYYALNFLYRFGLNTEQRTQFEYAVLTFNGYTKNIPITFLLGFYVTTVITRWSKQFDLIQWPDEVLSSLCAIIPDKNGNDGTVQRRTFARYLNLSTCICWRDISEPVRQRFPTIKHFVQVGLLTEEEHKLLEESRPHGVKWFVPLLWAQRIVEEEAPARGTAPPWVSMFLTQLNTYKAKLRELYCYDWVCIPLIYTQVTAIATYGYMALCIVGRQYIAPLNQKGPAEFEIDLYFPFFSVFQLIAYVGWYKVAIYLMKPFGNDDEDFELNYLIDRNIQESYAIVDQLYKQRPRPVTDKFHGQSQISLPHTNLSIKNQDREHPPKQLIDVQLKSEEEAKFVDHNCVLHMSTKSNDKNEKISKFRPF